MSTLTQLWTQKVIKTQKLYKTTFKQKRKTIHSTKKKNKKEKQKSILSYISKTIQLKYTTIYNVEKDITKTDKLIGVKLTPQQIQIIENILGKINCNINIDQFMLNVKWFVIRGFGDVFGKALGELKYVTQKHSIFIKVRKYDNTSKYYKCMTKHYIWAEENCDCFCVQETFYFFFWFQT